MLTKESIVELLRTDDRAVVRALLVLTDRQTPQEQACETTINHNGRGFTPADARVGTNMAKFFKERGYLTDKQIAYWRRIEARGNMRIGKYAGQLLEAAQAKAAMKAIIPANPYIGQDVGNLMELRLVLVEQYEFYDDGTGAPAAIAKMCELRDSIAQIDTAVKLAQQREIVRREAKFDRELV